MDPVVKKHLPAIIGITLLGVVATYFVYMWLHDTAYTTMTAQMFSWWLFLVPCIVMFICSFAIACTADEIGRQLYVVVLAICLVLGVISMFVASAWLSDQTIVETLLANSPADTVITPVLKSPMTILRDVAAWIVIPTVGCIFGAWVGSRLHPMAGEKKTKNKNKKKQK